MYYYDQIIEKEKYWSYLIEKGLLNVYTLKCNDGVKEFYLAKIRQLNGYLNSDPSDELKKVVKQLENIVKKIEIIIAKHSSGEKVDIKELTKYFLINAKDLEVKDDDLDIDADEIKDEVSKAISNYFSSDMPVMENITTQ